MENLENRVRETIARFSDRIETRAVRRRKPYLQEVAIPRDQRKNHDAIAAVLSGLSFSDEITPWVMQPLVDGRFILVDDFGIDPRPLFNLNSPVAAAELFQLEFGAPIERTFVQLEMLIADLRLIEKSQLLGQHTTQKMSYVMEFTGQTLRSLLPDELRENTVGLSEVISHTVELLQRSLGRLPKDHPKIAAVQDAFEKMEYYSALSKLQKAFSDYPAFETRPSMFYEVFADLVVETIASRHRGRSFANAKLFDALHFRRNHGVEWAFSPRDKQFIYSGDSYGDCTAYWVRSQVNEVTANIHWTVYTWLLDPFYRVLEVFFDGKQALKCHLLPLIIQGRPLLMLDAIEAVPQLRQRKDDSDNPDLDRKLYENRFKLIDCLFETCKELARRMGLEVVYVEKFSNAKWIREVVEDLPSDGYHVDEVEKPYSDDVVRTNIEQFTQNYPTCLLEEEIQAKNLRLMDQSMQRGYKDVAVLMGRRKNWRLKISGP